MSANSGTLPSTKGESTTISNKTTKLGYEHLDINKLYKGKSAEPVPKAVTQKHGMQTLGKAPPARRAGALTAVKSESTESSSNSAPVPTPPPQQPPPVNHQQPPPGWVGNLPHAMGPPPQPPHNHNVPGVPLTGPPHLEKKWSGGTQRGNGNFPSQRFAQDFPSLEATGDVGKGQIQNSSGPPPGTVTGLQSVSKASDNQYGPGPILRPQTEGSWTQGGGLGMPRSQGSMQSQNASSRDFTTDRNSLGGPTPPPMSLGQAGPIPPPLGAYPMSFRGMPPPPYMFQGSGGPPGPGGFFPPGHGMRYGMPIPPGAPPPGSYPPGGHPGDGRREESGRGGRGPPNQARPGSHFASTSIIKKGEMERMDEIGTQEGGWASTSDSIDYNKKINFSDDEDGSREYVKRSQANRNELKESVLNEEDWDRGGKLDKQQSINERDQPPRFESNRSSRDQYEHENEDDRSKRRPFDNKDRDRDRGARRPREDDWRSNSNRYDDDRGKKSSNVGSRTDLRGPSQDFQASKFPANIPPRFQRQGVPPSFNQPSGQRQTPSPVSTSGSSNKDRDRDYRDRDWERDRDRDQQSYREPPSYKILERRKTDSESSRDSKDNKRSHSNTDYDARQERFQEKDHGKPSRRVTAEGRSGGSDEPNKFSNSVRNTDKEVKDLDTSEPRAMSKDNLNKDDAKTAFRSRTELSTSSWADEVEDEESSKLNEDIDLRKGNKDSQLSHPKRGEERDRRELGPRRVFIHQRKVENLVTHTKPEAPEQKAQPQPKKEEKGEDKAKTASAWGGRGKEKESPEKDEGRMKEKVVHSGSDVEKSVSRDNVLKDKPSRPDDRGKEFDRQKDVEKHREYDKQTEPQKPKDFDKHKEHDKHKELPRQRDPAKDVDKRDRDDYERGSGSQRYRRDRKPAVAWNDRDKTKEDSPPVKERTPEKEKEIEKVKEKEAKEDDKKDKDDAEGRGQRGTRNRERGGCPVYQARGAWGNSGRARGGRGTPRSNGSSAPGSHYYDKAGKGYDSERDRERDEKENSREPSDMPSRKPEKEKSNETTIVSTQESSTKKDSQDEKPAHPVTRKLSSEKEGEPQKKSAKSPSGSRRNGNARGGSQQSQGRLQGYGPPSDRNPFSNNSKQDDEQTPKEKSTEHNVQKQHSVPPVTSGPVPLMALGEISPPEMPPRSRHHGSGYGHTHNQQQHGGRAMPPRMRGGGGDPSFSFRGGSSGGKRGGGNADVAKPLMSLNSNDLDRVSGDWISESESEAEARKASVGGTQHKKESNVGNKAPGAGSEKFRQNQNLTRSSSTGKASAHDQTNSLNLDSTNNNKGARSGGRGDSESYSGLTQPEGHDNAVTSEVEGTNTLPEGRKKPVGNKESKTQKENFEKGSGTASKVEKGAKTNRPVKNPPYDPRPQVAPRFLAAQQKESPPMQATTLPVTTGKSTSENAPSNSFKELAPVPTGNAWEKPITASLRPETQRSSMESKESDLKLSSSAVGISNQNTLHTVVSPIGQGSGSAPVQTMIFENTNFKSGATTKFPESSNKTVTPNKPTEGQVKKEMNVPSQSQGLEMSKEFPLNFGEDTPQLDFGSSFSDPPTSSSPISSHSQVYKSSGLLQSSRSYSTHQSSPISPLAADLNEKIQAVKSMWDLPSVAEQSGNHCGSEDDSLPGSFSSDAFKRPESTPRDYGQSLQQTSSGFAPGAPPSMSVIAKPDSRASPNLTNVRQIKAPQQNLMDPQNHAAVSSSPFAYGLAQQHQGTSNFGIRAAPSPPTLMYGTSLTSTTPNAVYQTLPQHVDSSQVVGSNARSQYQHYANAQVGNTGAAPYLGGSLFMPFFDSPYTQIQNYHSAHQHQQQAQGIPPVQVQSQNSRISPGPMPMTSASAGVVGGAVMMNSNTNSLMNMKSGQPGGVGHQNIGHHPANHQQGYSQFGLPHMGHPQHHLGPVGHQKQGYSQSNMPPQNQMYIPFDPNQPPVLNLGQNYLSGGLRTGHAGGPPPPATPPVQGLQSSSPYYGSAGSQTGMSGMYGGSSQGGNMPLHVAVAPGSQGLQNLRMVQVPKKKWNPKPHYP